MEAAAVAPPAIAPAHMPVEDQYSPLDFEIGFDDEFDLDAILGGFHPSGDDSVLWEPSPVAASPESVNSAAPVAAAAAAGVVASVEKFLFEDDSRAEVDVDGFVVQDFFKDILANFGDGSSGDGSGSDAGSPVPAAAAVGEKAEEGGSDGGDDPMSKKRKRQLRNKDSAMKSRQRKKAYVEELERKSRFLEAECRRLSYALQCCTAENAVLRQSLLQNGSKLGVYTARQESAVLFVESLPLGSLLWLVSTVLLCLSALHGPLCQDTSSPRKEAVRQLQKAASEGLEVDVSSQSSSIFLRRCCKASRPRMKPSFSLAGAILAC